MGLRDRAIEAKNVEEGNVPTTPQTKDRPLFDDDLDYYGGGRTAYSEYGSRDYSSAPWTGHRESLVDDRREKYKAIREAEQEKEHAVGAFTMTFNIPLTRLGDCADENSDKYNLDDALSKAEDIVLNELDKIIGEEKMNTYERKFESDDYVDEIEIKVFFSPRKE